MWKLLLVSICFFLLTSCSLFKTDTSSEIIVVDDNFLTDFFYKSGDIVIYENIDRKYQHIWTGQNMGFIPKDSYRAMDMKIASIQDDIWVEGQILMEFGNYINYLTGETSGYLQDISVFGYLKGKPFICSKIDKTCNIPQDNSLKSLVFKPWFEKNLYTIVSVTNVDDLTCYEYKNIYENVSASCIDDKGFITYYKDSAKKILINSYIMGKTYGTSISGN